MSLDLGLALGLFPTKKKMSIAIQDAIARKVGTEVATYSDLPPAVDHDGEYAWVLSAQGTKWLPGTLGGTYYPKGLYYSAAGAWQFTDSPIQATLTETNLGVDADTFVSPYTLANTNLIKKVQSFSSLSGFPTTGADNVVYIDKSSSLSYFWDGAAYQALGASSSTEQSVITDVSSTYWYVGYDTKIKRIDTSVVPYVVAVCEGTTISTDWPNRASLVYV